MPKPVATARSMLEWKFVLRRRRQVIRSAPSARVPGLRPQGGPRDRQRRGGGGRRFRRRENSLGSPDQRLAQGRTGNSGPDRERTDRQERRAHHQPHRAAGTFPGLHADGESHRRFAQDFFRGRAPAPEAHHPERARERPRRIHRSHRRAERQRRRTARRYPLPEGLVAGHQESRRELRSRRR